MFYYRAIMINRYLLSLLLTTGVLYSYSQAGYGNQWIFGRFNTSNPSGTMLNFNEDTVTVTPVNKHMEFEAACTVMCDSTGDLLFYSNGCYIARADHQMMLNGDSISHSILKTSFCNSGGNPNMQGILSLPKPGSSSQYYLFYTDLGDPYTMMPYFPLAPEVLYYAVIDMSLENGQGKVIEKNTVIVQDTFSRGMIQAARHANGKDWWVIQPESHSNCSWTLLLTENGIDTVFKQCIGHVWDDHDPTGQAVFAPDLSRYARVNYFNGLNLFDFDNATGLFSNPQHISFGQDTFYFNGAAFSSNSRFLYATCYNHTWQYDVLSENIADSRVLVGELSTPPSLPYKTRFNQAQLAPDGKIYIAGIGGFTYLHVIEKPNCFGLACNLQQYAIELAAFSSYTMPNIPHFKHWSNTDTCAVVGATESDLLSQSNIRFYPNPANDYISIEGLEGGEVIEWLDISGRVVKQLHQNAGTVNIADLTAGFYLVKVSRKGKPLGVFKVIKV